MKALLTFCTVCMLAFVAGAQTASARSVEPNYEKVKNSRWRCRSCPYELGQGSRFDLSATALQTDDVDARFGRDNGLTDDDSTFDASATYFRRDAETGRVIGLIGRDLGLDSGRLDLSLVRPNRFRASVSWSEIPRNEWLNARTAMTGTTNLRFPTNWTSAPNTQGMTQLVPGSRPTKIGTERRKAEATLAYRFGGNWTVEAGYARETKEGRALSSGDFLYQTTGLLTPIDHTTETLSAALQYTSGRWSAGLHMRESEFENANRSLTWQNPYTEGTGPGEGRKALAPDNEASEWGLTLRVSPFPGSVLRAHGRWGELRQNDQFLPPSVNPAVAAPPMPLPPGLDGTVDTSAANLQWVIPLGRHVALRLTSIDRERDNNTRSLPLTPVLGDGFPSLALQSRHYSYKRDRTAAAATFRLSSKTRLEIGVAEDERRRTLLEVESNTEDQQWAMLRVRLPRALRLSLRHQENDRDASGFRNITSNNPLTRRYFMAAREQTSWKASLSAPLGPVIHAGFSVDRRHSDYPASVLGVQSETDDNWSTDLTWQIAKHIHLSAHRSKHRVRSRTAGSSTAGNADWQGGTEDVVRTSTAELSINEFWRRASLSVTFDHSDGSGRYDTEFNSLLSVFPELVSKHRAMDLRLSVPFGEAYLASLRYYTERYESADWQLDGVAVNTLPAMITFGLLSPNYDARLVAITITRKL